MLDSTFISKKRKRENEEKQHVEINKISFFSSKSLKNKSDRLDSFDTEIKLVSLIAVSQCFICQRAIEGEYIQCSKCFRKFHKKCYATLSTKVEGNFECNFCHLYKKNLCSTCRTSINVNKSIIVYCELCENKMHLSCVNVGLKLLLSRNLYINHFQKNSSTELFYVKFIELLDNNYQNFDSRIKASENQEECLRDFSENVCKKNNLNYNGVNFISSNLFYVCQYCQKKPHETFGNKIINSTSYSNVKYGENSPFHSLYIRSSEAQDLNAKIITNEQSKRKPKKIISKFCCNDINFDRYYYLIKWDNKTYSLEFGEFLEKMVNLANEMNKYDEMNRAIDYKLRITRNRKKGSLLDQMQQNDYQSKHNIFSLDPQEIRHYKETVLVNAFSNVYQSQDEESYPKTLIIVDSQESKKSWMNFFKTTQAVNSKHCFLSSLPAQNYLDKILYEFIGYTSENNIYSSLLGQLNKIKAKYMYSNEKVQMASEITERFRQIKLKSDQLIPDILVIQHEVISDPIAREILLYFKFHYIVFYLESPDSYEGCLECVNEIKNGKSENCDSLVYFLANAETNYTSHFQKFLAYFYTAKDLVFQPEHSYIKDGYIKNQLLNRNVKIFSLVPKVFQKTFLTQFDWNLTIPNNVSLSAIFEQLQRNTKKPEEPKEIELCRTCHRTLVNFIPVTMDKESLIKYLYLIKEKIPSLMKQSETKKDILRAALTYCSFPKEIGPYYLKMLEGKLLFVSERINKSKIETTYKLIQKLRPQNKKIILVYSLESSYQGSMSNISSKTQEMKSVFGANEEDIFVYRIDEEKLFEHIKAISETTYLIFFNAFLFTKDFFFLLTQIMRKNMKYNEQIIIFQLFIKDIIEFNLVQYTYTRLENFINAENSSIFQFIGNEEKENLILRNLSTLDSNYFTNEDEPHFIKSYEYLETKSDGLIYFGNQNFLYCFGKEELLKNINRTFDKKELDIDNVIEEVMKYKGDERVTSGSLDESAKEEQSVKYGKEVIVSIEMATKYKIKYPETNNDESRSKSKADSNCIPLSSGEDQIEQSVQDAEDNNSEVNINFNQNENDKVSRPIVSFLSSLKITDDNSTKIDNYLLTLGFTQKIRKIILVHLLNWGLPDFDNFEAWTEGVLSNINYLDRDHGNILPVNLRFYYEYLIFTLLNSKYNDDRFLFFGKKISELKVMFLYIEIIKKNIQKQNWLENELTKIIEKSLINMFDNFRPSIIKSQKNMLNFHRMFFNLITNCNEKGFMKYNAIIKSKDLTKNIHGKGNIKQSIMKSLFGSNKIFEDHFNVIIEQLYMQVIKGFVANYEEQKNSQ